MALKEHPSAEGYEAAVAACRTAEGFVPQGGAWSGAEEGVAGLAAEIGEWWAERSTGHSSDGGGTGTAGAAGAAAASEAQASRELRVVLPAGTGTTALFLARHAPRGVRVCAVPCVGDAAYLEEQMRALDRESGGALRPRSGLPGRTCSTLTLCAPAAWRARRPRRAARGAGAAAARAFCAARRGAARGVARRGGTPAGSSGRPPCPGKPHPPHWTM